jgi:hypothetical protein
MAACLAAGRGSAVSHLAAAHLWKLPCGRECVEITVTKARSVRLEGVTVHRTSQLSGIDVVWVERIPVTSITRTVIDLAGVLTRRTSPRSSIAPWPSAGFPWCICGSGWPHWAHKDGPEAESSLP